MREVPRDRAWERRRRQERRKNGGAGADDLTDEDLNELRGCIELGHYATSPISSPTSTVSTDSLGSSSSLGSPRSDINISDFSSWKICNPGDDPEQVKTKLRHWAQVVACSVMQSS
ncbi:hypothetical protein F511_05092 [Dorcoceras hygrometricum]|uniref:Uncharacterized protein n=1 Tax=Dorcoceras hygrometricum TaxID=472368 RepID=A0A2Z7BCC5_9LAMI|nr:hypothetical protein F511_05092 [Dorcoceras hygrometricum]